MDKKIINGLKKIGVEFTNHNIFQIIVHFPLAMSREAIVRASIILMRSSDYESHYIRTLPDGTIYLIINLN